MKLVNVLVVDDEADFRDTLIKRLHKRNFSVRGAEGGREALGMMAEEPADVVLLDMRMPGMDGMQALQSLKSSHPDTQVIILTGHATQESARDCLRLGAYDYLLKPSTLDEILMKIKESLPIQSDCAPA